MTQQAHELLAMIKKFTISDTIKDSVYNLKHKEIHLNQLATGKGAAPKHKNNVAKASEAKSNDAQNLSAIMKDDGSSSLMIVYCCNCITGMLNDR